MTYPFRSKRYIRVFPGYSALSRNYAIGNLSLNDGDSVKIL